MSANKLKTKDLITIAIFSVVYVGVQYVCEFAGMIPVLFPFIVPVSMIPCGVVWAYLRAKVPKRFSVLIQCVIQALVMFIAGTGWFVAAGVLIGGLAAEVVTSLGAYKNFKFAVLGYSLFGIGITLGSLGIILLASDYYRDYFISTGGDQEFMNTILSLVSWPMVLGICALAVVGAIIGMLLGKAMLKKHFVKAGIA
jgi:energy-coupling factor transport system substrate-specific component